MAKKQLSKKAKKNLRMIADSGVGGAGAIRKVGKKVLKKAVRSPRAKELRKHAAQLSKTINARRKTMGKTALRTMAKARDEAIKRARRLER
jgi:hypothetical protein